MLFLALKSEKTWEKRGLAKFAGQFKLNDYLHVLILPFVLELFIKITIRDRGFESHAWRQ